MADLIKISDDINSTSSVVAASSKAVKSAYDLANGRAPKAHASTATTYGIGTGSNYGHVKISDSTSSTSAASAGIAASPKAVKAAYDKAVEAANSGGSKSVGDLWFGIDPKSKPANVQLYAGQSLSRSSYSAHWAFVNGGNRTVISESEWQAQVTANGFCPYYSSGNGSSTYRMPLLKGIHPKFVEALASAGAYTKAGLPGIYGSFGRVPFVNNIEASGAFILDAQEGAVSTGYNTTQTAYVGFNASRSSSIYGNSATVQPPAINMIVGEYVVGTVATIGEANATSLLASITHLEATAGTVKSVNGVNADAAGNVDDIAEYSTSSDGIQKCIRYTNGVQIVYGRTYLPSGEFMKNYTFHRAFNSTNYEIFGAPNEEDHCSYGVSGSIISASSFRITSKRFDGTYAVNKYFRFFAIGYWK